MQTGICNNIEARSKEDDKGAKTIVKRAWSAGGVLIVVIDRELAQEMKIGDGTALEQIPKDDGSILLKVRRDDS